MIIGDLVYDAACGLRGIIIDNLGPEDMWEVLYEDGEIHDTGDWDLTVIEKGNVCSTVSK